MEGETRQKADLDAFRYEVAKELGLSEKIREKGWDSLSDIEQRQLTHRVTERLKAQAIEHLNRPEMPE